MIGGVKPSRKTKEKVASSSAFRSEKALQVRTSLDRVLEDNGRVRQVGKMEKGIAGGLNTMGSDLLLRNRL